MNKQIDDIYQQVIDEDCDDPLYRFAELVRQDERQALAQPEQTPAAWRKKINGVWHYFDESTPFPFDDCEPLYEKN
jgi:hypothetical protein